MKCVFFHELDNMYCAALLIFYIADKTNSIRTGQFQNGSFNLHCYIISVSKFSVYRRYMLGVMIVLNLNKEYLTDDVRCLYPQ